MAPMTKKRARKEAPVQSKKRVRVDKGNGGAKTVALDTLPWNEVAFPEHFDDAEGFFGLEEISDVDVVRDTKLGKVEYTVCEILGQAFGVLLMCVGAI